MGCEGVDVDPVVPMRNGGGKLVNGQLVKGTYPGPPNNFSADDTESEGSARTASTFALAAQL